MSTGTRSGQGCAHRVCRKLARCAFRHTMPVDMETYSCPRCSAWIQGGMGGLIAHGQTVHNDPEQGR